MCLGQNDFVDFREILRTDRSDEYIKEKKVVDGLYLKKDGKIFYKSRYLVSFRTNT